MIFVDTREPPGNINDRLACRPVTCPRSPLVLANKFVLFCERIEVP